jgi:hypothetical protein
MGMHEFEDLVEMSIRILVKSDRSDLRDIFACLYQFQSRYDTGYTHFRVMEHLLNTRFVYKCSLNEHPDYSAFREALDKVQQADSGWVYLDPSKKGSENNRGAGYWKKPFLYFDAGSALWQKFVNAGKLTGQDAQPPKRMNIADVALIIVKFAEKFDCKELIAWWYALLPSDIWYSEPKPLKNDPVLREILEISERNGAPEMRSDYGVLRYPTFQDLSQVSDSAYRDFFSWWFKDALSSSDK